MMKYILVTVATASLLTSAAIADEPMQLSTEQLDWVTAGAPETPRLGIFTALQASNFNVDKSNPAGQSSHAAEHVGEFGAGAGKLTQVTPNEEPN